MDYWSLFVLVESGNVKKRMKHMEQVKEKDINFHIFMKKFVFTSPSAHVDALVSLLLFLPLTLAPNNQECIYFHLAFLTESFIYFASTLSFSLSHTYGVSELIFPLSL